MTRIRAINLTKTVRHQLSFDDNIGTDDAITWILGALDSRILATIKDRDTGIPLSALAGGNTEGTATLNINQTNFDVVLFGLKGFENFKNEDDTAVEYKTATSSLGGKSYLTVDPEIVKMMPIEAIEELASVIIEINTLKEEERKN